LINRSRVTIQGATGCANKQSAQREAQGSADRGAWAARARIWFRVEVQFAHRTWLQGREEVHMGVQLNHTIVWCVDKVRSATFLADILDLPAPTRFGPFQVIELENTVSLDFHETKDRIARIMPFSLTTSVLMPCSLASERVVCRIGQTQEDRNPTR
jgi:hypothetical protein